MAAHDLLDIWNAAPKRTRVPPHWTLAQRIAHYTDPQNERGCILWTGAKAYFGYGVLNWNGKVRLMHRLAWELANGPIPNGMSVCHRCDVTGCINPDHLFIGTFADNMADKVAKSRQGAPRGEASHFARLTATQVLEIRASTGRHREIAGCFGVSHTAVGNIKRGKTWRAVT